MLEVKQISTAAFALLSYIIQDPLTKECLVIDPPSGIQPYIDSETMNIKAVINTHLHPDHTMGNSFFSGKVPIRAHPGERGFIMRAFNSVISTLYTAKIPPRISFDLEDQTTISLGDTSIMVLHTPGHSPGSICLYWPGNLICGDTVFVGNIGRTDIPGGNTQKLRESIRKIMTLPPDTIIWPGHHYMDSYTSTLSRESSFLTRVIDSIR
jgi:hydroxyacylglutathione hydrolase